MPALATEAAKERDHLRAQYCSALHVSHEIPTAATSDLTTPFMLRTDAELPSYRDYLYQLAARPIEYHNKESEGLYVNSHHMDRHCEQTVTIAANEQYSDSWARQTCWNANGGFMQGPVVNRDGSGGISFGDAQAPATRT